MGDENPQVPGTSAAARKREEKARKKDQRSLENILKIMGDVSEAEKLEIIQEKYVDLYNELRRTSWSLQTIEKRVVVLEKEREQQRIDLNKTILAKSKLESLCRELQKQNKAIKDENIMRVKEEEEKRREVATNFTERLNSLSSMMDENKDKSIRLREENMNMTLKLTELYNKFQEREKHLADVNRQLDAQKELFQSKIKKMDLEYKTDRKAWEEESKALLSNLLKSNETNRLLEENIKSMQANLDVYKNQYSDFEVTMSRSNEVFKTFHLEIVKLQRSNNLLEKEKNEYITKWQSCHNSVVEISEKNQQLVKRLEMGEKKVATLEKLCRQLQTERTVLHKQLQDKIEPTIGSQLQHNGLHQIPTINCSAVQQSTPEIPLNNNITKELTNGELKSTEDNVTKSLIKAEKRASSARGSRSSTTASEEESSQADSELPSGLLTDSDLLTYADYEMDTTGAGSIPQLEAQVVIPLSSETTSTEYTDDLEGTMLDIQDPTGETEIYIKEARSVPITKKEHEQIDEDMEEPTSSDANLHGDESTETVPLYKPAGVTDVPTQGGHISFVKESEGHTNILEATTDEESAAMTSGTIILKESEGKTELPKEDE